jgi:hypothetical protein
MDDVQISKQVELRNARVWLGADGLARYIAQSGADVTLADAEACHAAVLDLYQGETHPLLVDIRKVKSASREARKFFAGSTSNDTTRAVALLVSSPVSWLIGNFFLSINKPAFPVRLFTNETEALGWLRSFL